MRIIFHKYIGNGEYGCTWHAIIQWNGDAYIVCIKMEFGTMDATIYRMSQNSDRNQRRLLTQVTLCDDTPFKRKFKILIEIFKIVTQN